MRKFTLPLVFSVVILSLFSSCDKIRERRLQGSWLLTEWNIVTDTGDLRMLQQHADVLPYDKIILEFLDDNVLLVSAFENGEVASSKESLWVENEKFDKLGFPDSIFLFNPNVTYKIEQLSREHLVLKGKFTISGITYPNVSWELDKL